MVFFWFLHVFHIYFNVQFPLKSLILKDKKKVKILHFSEISVCIFLSALGPGVVWLSNNEYNVVSLPPLLCLPATNSLIFYTICVPIIFLLTIGVNLIAMILWTLLQVNNRFVCMMLHWNQLVDYNINLSYYTDGMSPVVMPAVVTYL